MSPCLGRPHDMQQHIDTVPFLLQALLAAVSGLWGWSLLVDALPRPLLDTSSSSVAVIVPVR